MTCDSALDLLLPAADPRIAAEMAAYTRNKFRFLGIHTPERRARCKGMLRQMKASGNTDWEFVQSSWDNPYREMQYVATDYLHAVQERMTPADMERIEGLIRTKSWWDTVDSLHGVAGHIALRHTEANRTLLAWSNHEDIWLRRAAIDHQIGRKKRTDPALLETILCNNFGTGEFFIDKAIGWSLRDYAKTDPAWVRAFIDRHRERMAPLSLREAAKHL